MTKALQMNLNFDDTGIHDTSILAEMQETPKGYKGLSGFHKYWGKKPTEAWRFLIANLTEKNDIILDPFLGSGLIVKECIDLQRRFVGFDINPISIELTKFYLDMPNFTELKSAIGKFEKNLKSTINEIYLLPNGSIASHFLWENDHITKIWIKNGRTRVEVHLNADEMEKFENIYSYNPKNTRDLQLFDNSRINAKKSYSLSNLFTPRALYAIDLLRGEIDKFDGSTKRALLLILSSSLGQMSNMVFAISNRGKNKGDESNNIEVGSWVIGYWRPEQHFEVNVWNCFENKARKLVRAVKEAGDKKQVHISDNYSDLLNGNGRVYISLGDSEILLKDIPSNTIKVILTDPPHGDRIPYLELSEMWNSIIGIDSDYENELVISNAKERKKNLHAYNRKLNSILAECSRVLVDDGIIAVMFNARSKDHWNSLNELKNISILNYIGCYPMKYSACSVVQNNRKGGLKTDFVLLYGKNVSDSLTKDIVNKFKNIRGWSTKYPKGE